MDPGQCVAIFGIEINFEFKKGIVSWANAIWPYIILRCNVYYKIQSHISFIVRCNNYCLLIMGVLG